MRKCNAIIDFPFWMFVSQCRIPNSSLSPNSPNDKIYIIPFNAPYPNTFFTCSPPRPLPAILLSAAGTMATLTMSRPLVSSPLADSSSSRTAAAQRVIPRRNTSFPSSRALRPFPSISNSIQQPGKPAAPGAKKAVKLIEPPKNQIGTFVLDLTQAEFSRQD